MTSFLTAACALALSALVELAPALSSLLSRAAPPVRAGVRPCDSRVSPAQVASAPPQKPVPAEAALPAFTSPAVDDAPCLTQRCVCGAATLRVGLLTTHSTCLSCCRCWSSLNGRSYFMPVVWQHSFAKANGLAYGGGRA